MAHTNDSRPSEAAGGAAASSSGALPLVALAALFALTALVYVALGQAQRAPIFSPDEFLYGHLARSLADGEGLSWRGDVTLRASLLVRLLAPLWHTGSLYDAYQHSKVLGGIAISTVILPVWFVARGFLGSWRAFAPAILAVLGVWMTSAGGILTENLAFPLGVAAMACIVPYLQSSGIRWGVTALAFAALATFARAELAVIFPIIFVAIVIEAGLTRGDWWASARRHAVVGGLSGLVTLVGLLAAIANPSAALGIYQVVGSTTPDLGDLVSALKAQLTALVVSCAIVPIIVVFAGSLRKDVWSDRSLRALLLVTWLGIAGFVGISAYFIAVVPGVSWSIERYVMYAIPLMLVTMVVLVDRGAIELRRLVGASALVAVLVATTPGVRGVLEERGLYALNLRIGDLVGTGTGLRLVIVTALLAGLTIGAIALGRSSGRLATLLIVGITALTAVIQAQAGWAWQKTVTGQELAGWRSGYSGDPSWIDQASSQPVSRFVTTSNPPRFELTDYFNRRIDRVYVPDRPVGGAALAGRRCLWTADDTGAVTFEAACGARPTRLFLDDDFGKVTFYGQRVRKTVPVLGRIVDLPRTTPRIKALVYVPCSPPVARLDPGGAGRTVPPVPYCPQPLLSGEFYLDGPARLVLTWRGGTSDNQIQIGKRVYNLPAGELTRTPLDVPAGSNPLKLPLPWNDPPPASPKLVSARLVQDGRSEELLY